MNHKAEIFVAIQRVMPKHLLSRLIGRLAESKIIWLKNFLITRATSYFGINMDEAMFNDQNSYRSFNDFFTRSLKEHARPIAEGSKSICSPADGVISQAGSIKNNRIVQAKGIDYSISRLLGDSSISKKFNDGRFATIYLSPKDYHRVHIPTSGQLIKTRYIPGELFSVNALTAEGLEGLFTKNERLVCQFKSESIGDFIVVLVGAMLVAGIETVWNGLEIPGKGSVRESDYSDQQLLFEKGDEIGKFRFGSTAIVLFTKDKVSHMASNQPQRAVRMGEEIAQVL
jgi:phosphatidylserine decarboxylase